MISSSVTSMQAHRNWMDVSANNVANINTRNFKADDTIITDGPGVSVRQTEGPTDLAEEMTDQIVIAGGFAAQTSVVRTEDEMLGTLLDMKG